MSIRDTEFLTSAEVADKLKLNQQVVLRKLRSGEIPGYKLGGEWRVADHELEAWLAPHSNQHPSTKRNAAERAFFKNGKLVSIPAQHKKRVYVLERLVEEFEPQTVYLEAEVNRILGRFHSDVAWLRRELVGQRMMVRSEGNYMRASSYVRSPDN
jgi:excisionase family DNA binding protein